MTLTSLTELSISIITTNKGLVLDCLKSIYETTTGITPEIYVVINHPPSSDDIEVAIRRSFPEVSIIKNREEMGFTHNNNLVIKRCAGKYILILNDDTVILEGALQKMIHYMDTHPEVGILGCRILNPDGTLQWSCGKSFSHKFEYFKAGLLRTLLSPLIRDQFFSSTKEVSWVTGACMLVRMDAMKKAGLMDENIYMYFEDGDLCYRIIKAGWKVVFNPDAEIIHYRSKTSEKIPAKTTSFYYKSRLYFFSKHYPSVILPMVRFLTVFDVIINYMKTLIFRPSNQKKEILSAYLGALRLALFYKRV